jgi:hypothetical protein
MAQTKYGDLRDAFHVSCFTSNGLLRQADFFSILLNEGTARTEHVNEFETLALAFFILRRQRMPRRFLSASLVGRQGRERATRALASPRREVREVSCLDVCSTIPTDEGPLD